MKSNAYLEEFKIQAVRRIYAGESQKNICQELMISKSTLWGWKCKYKYLINKELQIEEKPYEENGFVEILKPMKETRHSPVFRYQNADTVEINYRDSRIICTVNQLMRVLEVLQV